MPISTTLRTPWADQAISSPHPLPECPRPMLQRAEWASLNGAWEYALVPARGALGTEALPGSYEGTITVPFAIETVASGVTRALGAEETLFYRRRFTTPETWRDPRVALNIEAAGGVAAVWVDRQLADDFRDIGISLRGTVAALALLGSALVPLGAVAAAGIGPRAAAP